MNVVALGERRALALASPRIGLSEFRIFIAATAAIVLHIADYEFVQRQAGTSAGDHLAAGLVPIGVALAAVWGYPRLRAGLRAAIALVFGILSMVAGMITVGGARADGLSGSEWSGLLLLPAGAALVVLSAWIPWHSRVRSPNAGRRVWANRVAALVITPLVLFYLVVPIGAALWATQKYRTPIGSFQIPHQET